jgi:hypothetical protein
MPREAVAADFGLQPDHKPMPKAMSPGFAVFNLHVNKGGDRAFTVMARHFPKYWEEVKALETEGNGIMHIFNVPITPAIAVFVALVTTFVNEDRI